MGGILALDIATNLGWAWGYAPKHGPATALEAAAAAPAQPASGVYRVRGDSLGEFLADYERWLGLVLDERQPGGLMFEAPILGKFTAFATARKLMSLAGLTELVAHRRGIPWVREAQPSTVKKHFTGSGKAKKPDMEAACLQRGWTFADDNEADALALFSYACSVVHAERAGRCS
jgi:Holliday junction resolvasome RuvABC endonuclease subunit